MKGLPRPIAEFFRLKNAEDDEGLSLLFSDDATVIDAGEGKEMHGRDAIKKWIEKSTIGRAVTSRGERTLGEVDTAGSKAAISGLSLRTDVRDWKEHDGEWTVDTVLTGNFKTSPARFEYFISLSGERISTLRVEFRGSQKL